MIVMFMTLFMVTVSRVDTIFRFIKMYALNMYSFWVCQSYLKKKSSAIENNKNERYIKEKK